MSDCLFCKIIKGEIPSKKVFENESVYAFLDINPLAQKHILFISKNHNKNINELVEDKPQDLISIFKAIKEYTEKDKLNESGFRVVTNLGKDALQTVFHTHFHVLGGERLGNFGKAD